MFDFDSSIERKNPLAVVLAFQDAFRAGEEVELIVKTSNVNPQHWSNASRHWENLIASALGDRRIKIVTQRYSDDEMTALVRDADCIVSLHRSEGFGYLAADAMAFGTPVIATDYSGNADFCTANNAYPVSYKLIAVPAGAARWRCDDALMGRSPILRRQQHRCVPSLRTARRQPKRPSAPDRTSNRNMRPIHLRRRFAQNRRNRAMEISGSAAESLGVSCVPAWRGSDTRQVSLTYPKGVARTTIFRD